jgi:NADPH-dependent 2,4-dienoyl-CoA reductase/sulfur reductase-like enzyme
MVAMTRAHIADPHIVAKLERGEEDRIRVCVGASVCINRLHQGLDSVCIQNPATGRETHIPQLIARSPAAKKKAVVVGAGPAGLEAARVLAERGHEVVLFEAQNRVGGQIVLAARASERQAELLGIVGWLELELAHAGVDVRLDTPVDGADVRGENPDIVVVATGGFPDTSFLLSGEESVHTTWDVLGGHAVVAGKVLIYDDHGGENAPSVAEYLSVRGVSEIELVTPDRLVAQDLAATTGPAYLGMLYERNVVMTPDHQLISVERNGSRLIATLRNVFTRGEVTRIVDAVVTEHGVVPNDELYLELRDVSANDGAIDIAALTSGEPQPAADDGFVLYRIGDAVASRGIAAAIYEARRLCQLLM